MVWCFFLDNSFVLKEPCIRQSNSFNSASSPVLHWIFQFFLIFTFHSPVVLPIFDSFPLDDETIYVSDKKKTMSYIRGYLFPTGVLLISLIFAADDTGRKVGGGSFIQRAFRYPSTRTCGMDPGQRSSFHRSKFIPIFSIKVGQSPPRFW